MAQSSERDGESAKYTFIVDIYHMWIPRHIEPRLLRSARTRPVVMPCGTHDTHFSETGRKALGKTPPVLRYAARFAAPPPL